MPTKAKAPWLQRVGVLLLTTLAAILIFWLLGFVVDDIGAIRGPQLADVERRVLDQRLVRQSDAVDKQVAAIAAEIDVQKSRQALLRDSTNSSQQTMNQLLDVEKQNVAKGVTPSAAEQNALAQSETLFIENQTRYQALNQEIVRRSDEQHRLEDQKRAIEAHLAGQRERASEEFQALQRQHNLKVAALQLLVLVPLLIAAVYCVLRWRASIYAPLVFAFGAATLTKVILVVHEHFPTRYFKYVLLLFSLAVVVRILVSLIRATKSPKLDALLRQYREAYERFLCPICEYPIRRGPLRFRYWDRRSLRKLLPPADAAAPPPEEPYACPSCGSGLFERCTHCGGIRHSLLLFCEHCGHQKPLAEAAA